MGFFERQDWRARVLKGALAMLVIALIVGCAFGGIMEPVSGWTIGRAIATFLGAIAVLATTLVIFI